MSITRAKTSSVAQGPSTKKTVLGGNDVILGGSYDAIGVVDVGVGGTSSITFTSIPSTYRHLQIRALYLNTGSYSNIEMQFNGDSATNYSWHEVYGDGSGVGATAYVSVAQIRPILGAVNTTNQATGIIDILDYSNTNKFKTIKSLSGADTNGGTNYILLRSGNWRNTNAITSISFTPQSGSIGQYSSFALYGIK